MFVPLVATVSILTVFIILQFVLDTVRAQRFKRVADGLVKLGKQQAITTVSVVIKARGTKQQVTELLDHLASFNYDELQVVVVPRSRGSSRSDEYLTNYRAAHPRMNIRIVRSGKRDDKTIAARHARGELIFWMGLSERLSPRFFELASYEFARPDIDRVDVPYRFKAARTVADLMATWSVIRSETIGVMRSKQNSLRRPVYRRASFKKAAPSVTAVKAGTQLAFVRPRSTPAAQNAAMVLSNLLVAGGLGYAALYYVSTQWLFTVLAIACVYLLSNLFWLVSSKRYSFSEAAALIFALPFAVIGNAVSRFAKIRP